LRGWWETGNGFHCVSDNGHAFSTSAKPADANQKLVTADSTADYFEVDEEVVFVWRNPGVVVRVEKNGVLRLTLQRWRSIAMTSMAA
jgi:hypothetical protein